MAVATKRKRPARRRGKQDIDLALGIVLDMSGSMSPIQLPTIEAVNQYVQDQRKQEGRTWLTLVMFDTEFIKVHMLTPLVEVPELTAEVYRPRGGTALYDAIGYTIRAMEKALAEKGAPKPDKALVAVFTDGQENSSHEFSRGAIQARIKVKQEQDGWDFAYMGANHDPFAVAVPLGIRRGYTSAWQATPAGVADALLMTTQSTSGYRQATAQNLASGKTVAESSPESFYGGENK